MIISASRRTDIPAYYSEWFYNRIKEGFVCVRNPYNPRRVSKIILGPDNTEGIVFWTKNPGPMMNKLDIISGFTYYFQFTLNAYGKEIEPKYGTDESIAAFKRLADKIGSNRVIWRYDPILLSEKYDIYFHIESFNKICLALSGYTEKCTVSFIDQYRHIIKKMRLLNISPVSENDMKFLLCNFKNTAPSCGISIDVCAETLDMKNSGVHKAKCIDKELIESLGGKAVNAKKDPFQRNECLCAQSIDIGAYNSCPAGCAYCYANSNLKAICANMKMHGANNPLLYGGINEHDIVYERNVSKVRKEQINDVKNRQ